MADDVDSILLLGIGILLDRVAPDKTDFLFPGIADAGLWVDSLSVVLLAASPRKSILHNKMRAELARYLPGFISRFVSIFVLPAYKDKNLEMLIFPHS